ncbi:10620_t:CDS:2, partial [Racocetra fulgida]
VGDFKSVKEATSLDFAIIKVDDFKFAKEITILDFATTKAYVLCLKLAST